jgi:hypothetical protein
MIRLIGVVGLLIAACSSGCSLCCTPYDDAYPAYGGKWQREDRYHGRVGSAFEPAGGMVTGESALMTDESNMMMDESGGYEEITPEPTPAMPNDDTVPLPETEGESLFFE